MTHYMDEVVGDLVAALKRKDMYDDTLIVFTADNGGPIYEPGAANNHPLKGGKYSDWEGGVRTNTFVSGGYVPAHRRGKRFHGVVSIADWYGTLCEIAGVDQTDYAAKKANKWLARNNLPLLRPVDSVQQWKHIVRDTNGRPGPLHLSANVVLQWPYKLGTGVQSYSSWQGEVYPNCSTVSNYQADGPVAQDLHILGVDFSASNNATEEAHLLQDLDCGAGCLYNVEEDPTEHTNLAGDRRHAAKLAELQAALFAMNETNFNPDRGELDLAACQVSIGIGGYYGPFVGARGFYSPVEFTMKERLENLQARVKLTKLNTTLTKDNERTIKFLAEKLDVHSLILSVPDQCFLNTTTTTTAGTEVQVAFKK